MVSVVSLARRNCMDLTDPIASTTEHEFCDHLACALLARLWSTSNICTVRSNGGLIMLWQDLPGAQAACSKAEPAPGS